MRSLDPPLPMARTTTTWAASITKSVFATYVMQLVERGEFELDTPVAKQLAKPLDQYEPYRETASLLGQDLRWQRVTPRMLLPTLRAWQTPPRSRTTRRCTSISIRERGTPTPATESTCCSL